VSAAIYFNDNVIFYADKINNKGTHRILPPEFPAAQLPIPQMAPQQPFGIGQAFSQGFGALVGHEPPLTPTLSPRRGEGEKPAPISGYGSHRPPYPVQAEVYGYILIAAQSSHPSPQPLQKTPLAGEREKNLCGSPAYILSSQASFAPTIGSPYGRVRPTHQ